MNKGKIVMSNNERIIKPVSDNIDKQRTYTTMLTRYNLAMKDGFYLEAILIDYAMMEDRLRSFIYHIGGLVDRSSIKIVGKCKKHLKDMVLSYDPKGNLGISSITGKLRIVRAILSWEENCEGTPDDKYLKVLKSRLESLDIAGLYDMLKEIENWNGYRNECIHSVMNKNIDSRGDEVAVKANEGMKLARFLDSQVKILKKKNVVRKAAGLKA